MSLLDTFLSNIPSIAPSPGQHSFNDKLKWTGIVVLLYFMLTIVPIYGLQDNVLAEFQSVAALLGASFGTLATLGIGPIVTASIVLQLLKGSGIINLDTNTPQGKARFQGLQKVLAIFFIIFQSTMLVQLGGFTPAPGISPLLLIAQLSLGGIFIVIMDEIVGKWGFGKGVSLFIAAGISQQIFIALFNFLTQAGAFPGAAGGPAGRIPNLIYLFFTGGPQLGANALNIIAVLIATAAVFLVAVYLQAMKVEIPLSFGRVRGHGMRWPLQFLYANVIPIIFIGAIVANLRLLGGVTGSSLIQSITPWLTATTSSGQTVLESVVQTGQFTWTLIGQTLTFLIFYAGGAAIFSIFWVQTSGMDAKSQAEKLMNSGMQIPGFRRDKRVVERILQRYIGPLTILGGLTIGLLAGVADLTGAIGTGTGLLLTVMILYRQYQQIAEENLKSLNPMMRNFID
jgi:preprotein translocase subunit SecY